MDRFAVPETAIASFERVHDVLVTIHDFTGRILPRLAVNRGYHRHPLCHAAKARDHERACRAFDLDGLHAVLPQRPDGFIQRCHAGLVEAVVPLKLAGEIVGAINAGPRAGGSAAAVITRTAATSARPDLPAWSAAEALDVLESLRQLAARLERWLEDTRSDRTLAAPDRRRRILHFIEVRCRRPTTLAHLAAELRLSVDRTGHVVRQEFGTSFLALLAGYRLERASSLLSHTDLPVATIAAECGFGDLSGFHRRFRAHFGTTPLRFRAGGRGTGSRSRHLSSGSVHAADIHGV